MNKQDKELLLKELCMRLPYGVKVCAGEDLVMTLKQIDYNCFCDCWENEDIKCHSRWMLPYLRPMSSMTEEEKKEYDHRLECMFYDTMYDDAFAIDWLNAHHFDYRGLIEKGLAIAVTEKNNPYENIKRIQ